MIYKNIELFGIERMEQVDGCDGLRLWRVTEEGLNNCDPEFPNAQYVMKLLSSNEMRFVINSGVCEITIDVYDCEFMERANAFMYFGEFQFEIQKLHLGRNVLKVEVPKTIADYVKTEYSNEHYTSFCPLVARVMIPYGVVHLVDVVGDIRPPKPSEVPTKKMLCYGTSITQGLFASSPALFYPKILARRLGIDVFNYGFCGCCMLEKYICDTIINSNFDMYLLEISVNMLNKAKTAKDFAEKAEYLVSKLIEKGKKVVAISPLLHYTDIGVYKDVVSTVCSGDDYRKELKAIAEKYACDNLIFIDGRELVQNFTDLSADLIHPGDYGMINFALEIEKRVKDKWGNI
ncbi:MAG: SGNH/GDSL hydrolase family protein [Clostridia bacterium]